MNSKEQVIYGESEYPYLNEGLLVLNVAQLAPVIAVDTETNAQDVRDGRGYARGVSIAFTYEDESYSHYYPFRHNHGENYDKHTLSLLRQVLEAAPALVYHNAKFDIVALRTLGIDVVNTWFFDTMIAAHMLDENQYKDLDHVALNYLGEHGKLSTKELDKEKKQGFPNSTAAFVKEYAEKDAESTFRLGEHLLPLLYEEAGEGNWLHKMELTRVLIAMEGRGVRINTDLANELAIKGTGKLEQLTADMGVNPGSPKGLKEVIIDRLGLPVVKASEKTGAPSFDKFAMEKYEVLLDGIDSPVAHQLKEFRGWQKAVSSYYKPYVERLSPDGRLRCNFKMHGTITGRFSCAEPNLQQIPKESDKEWNGRIKECMVPEDGYVLIEADYSQLELRLGTAYAKESKLIEVFNDPNRDIFDEMSKQLGFTRQETKGFVYSTQYGAGVNRIMTVFHVDAKRAKAIIDRYYRTYPAFRKIMDTVMMTAEANGRIRYWSGRYRHFKDASRESYKAFNSLIQGGSADIMERVMVRLYHEVDNEDECRMLLQVHDAVTFEIREELVEQYTERILAIMEDVDGVLGFESGVRFAVDSHAFGGEA